MPGEAVEDRKYRQRGYKDFAGKKPETREAPSASRAPRMPGSRSVARCADCGTLLPTLTDASGQCPQCRAELHVCRQCAHFDPGRRFECAQPILERIPDKRARNECSLFSLRVTVERDSSAGALCPEDARRAFENLFKK